MKMIEQLRDINELSDQVNLDDFYSITFNCYGGITLQGRYSSDKVLKYQDHFKTAPIVCNGGFVHIKVNGIEIVLTD